MFRQSRTLPACLTLVALALSACAGAATSTPVAVPPAPATAPSPALQVIWFGWEPCRVLTDLSRSFPGGPVEVRCVPIAEWHDQIFRAFAAKTGADVVILDSQYIGEAVKGGHILDLTSWMKTNIDTADYVPAALAAYGEYPAGSGRYYGVAAEADTQMLVYRKDAFDKAAADYKAQTGADLGVPKTWSELLRIAQFFKSSGGKYGVDDGYTTHWCGAPACYDQMATHWNQILWSFGGELWNPATYKVQGYINSETALRALNFDRELFKTGPEGQASFTHNETVDALCNGATAMATIWFGFGSGFADKRGCANSASLAFGGAPGEVKRFTSLGGQGLHVSAYTQHKDLALAYVKWFESEETQLAWAQHGGFSARKSVLASDTFKNAAPYNPAFAETYQYVKDFWNIPEYNAMLAPQMKDLNLAVSGQMDPKAALDDIARQQQTILETAYPNGPPK